MSFLFLHANIQKSLKGTNSKMDANRIHIASFKQGSNLKMTTQLQIEKQLNNVAMHLHSLQLVTSPCCVVLFPNLGHVVCDQMLELDDFLINWSPLPHLYKHH